MEKREYALAEALENNAREVENWKTYLKENEMAIENLDEFNKKLEIDVMIPIGKKAFIPGQLIHTNEVMVSHYQGYFSNCTAHKAKEICNYRIKMAKQRLDALQVEAELYENKLTQPLKVGVLPSEEQIEIVEEYDEDKERQWRERHKILLKSEKQREKEEREQKAKQEKELPIHKIVEKITKPTEEMEKSKLKNDSDDSNEDGNGVGDDELLEELEKELNALSIDELSAVFTTSTTESSTSPTAKIVAINEDLESKTPDAAMQETSSDDDIFKMLEAAEMKEAAAKEFEQIVEQKVEYDVIKQMMSTTASDAMHSKKEKRRVANAGIAVVPTPAVDPAAADPAPTPDAILKNDKKVEEKRHPYSEELIFLLKQSQYLMPEKRLPFLKLHSKIINKKHKESLPSKMKTTKDFEQKLYYEELSEELNNVIIFYTDFNGELPPSLSADNDVIEFLNTPKNFYEILLEKSRKMLKEFRERQSIKASSSNDADELILRAFVKTINDDGKYLTKKDRHEFFNYQMEILQSAKWYMESSNAKEQINKIKIQLQKLIDESGVAALNNNNNNYNYNNDDDDDERLSITSESDDYNEAEEDDDSYAEMIITAEREQTEQILSAKGKNGMKKRKNRISFALEDNQTLEFRRNEAVSQMLPRSLNDVDDDDNSVTTSTNGGSGFRIKKRDIIKLDDDKKVSEQSPQTTTVIDKKAKILEIVEKDLKNKRENGTGIGENCDLVGQILNSMDNPPQTLYIKFKHSEQQRQRQQQTAVNLENVDENIPTSPADIYDFHMKNLSRNAAESNTIFFNSYDGEEKVKVPILKEEYRKTAYKDLRHEYSRPGTETKENKDPGIKSILRNKAAVEQEEHFVKQQMREQIYQKKQQQQEQQQQQRQRQQQQKKNKQNQRKKGKTTTTESDEYMTAYSKVMNDVVEKPTTPTTPTTTTPEPLPNGKYIDAKMPKKRVSHFKQMRGGNINS